MDGTIDMLQARAEAAPASAAAPPPPAQDPAMTASPAASGTAAVIVQPRQSADPAAPKPAYPPTAPLPTQSGPKGLRFDFNEGCRVLAPESDHPWHVRISDLDTGNVLYETDLKAGRVSSTKRYYVRFRVEAWQQAENLLRHDYNAEGQPVLINFPIGTLGDTLGWFPYAVKFRDKHKCQLTCAMAERLIPLFKPNYPDIEFVGHEGVQPERYYATYSIGLFFDDKDCIFQPTDFRHVGLHRTAGYILGVDPTEVPPKIALDDDSRPIAEPYVCIAVQSTTQSKCWNNPLGWHEVVRFLKEHGYRVICIDQRPVHGAGIVWNHIPHGAEDETGDRPLVERARWLRHADFFIGLSSGLAWLAWSVGTPVVMISGFTHPTNEFATPYRIINYHACNSCWNDPRHRFDHHDFLWCPRHADTPRQFECTRLITAEHVKQVIRTIPGFGTAAARR